MARCMPGSVEHGIGPILNYVATSNHIHLLIYDRGSSLSTVGKPVEI